MMSKLSGILPATPRILSTDISRAQPLRAGAPRYWGFPETSEVSGRSILTESALDRVSWSPAGKQDLADKAIPVKADDFFLRQPEMMGPSVGEFMSPIAPNPEPAGPVVSGPQDLPDSIVGQRLNIEA